MCNETMANERLIKDPFGPVLMHWETDGEIVQRFLEESCEASQDKNISFARLYKRFDAWHRDTIGSKVWSEKHFGRTMKESQYRRITKRGRVYYEGIRLKTPSKVINLADYRN